MAVETKTIKMRRGLEAELDRSKLLSGEFGIATDTKKVFIGMGSGQSKELASREDVQTLIDNFGNVVDAEIEYATNAIREEGERVLATIPDDFEEVAAKADEAVRTKSDAIILTNTGEHITNPMTAHDPLRGLKLYGKGKQVKTTGKNLLNINRGSATVSGVTFTVNDDRSVTANGTATATADFSLVTDFLDVEKNTNYILSGCPNGGGVNKYGLRVSSSDYSLNYYDYGEGIAFNSGDDIKMPVVIRVYSGVTVSNLTFYPMIRLATIEDPTYEPYTGGLPSPSPEYPQEIETCGKVGNLLDLADKTTTGAVHVYEKVPVSMPKGIYTFSCKHNLSTSLGWWVAFYNASGVNVGGSGILLGNVCRATFELRENAVSLSIYFDDRVTVSEIMLNEGTTALPYRPYNGGQREIETEVLGGNLVIANIKGYLGATDDKIKIDGDSEGFVFYAKKGVAYTFGSDIDFDRTRIAYAESFPKSETPYFDIENLAGSRTFVSTNNAYCFIYANSSRNDEIAKTFRVNVGDKLLPYSPYHRQSHITTVPNGLPGIEVTDASLANYVDEDGKMWCADEIDYERGVYVQRVNVVDFKNAVGEINNIPVGTGRYRLDFTIQNNPNFYAGRAYNDAICNALTANNSPLGANDEDNTISCYINGGVYIRCDRFETAREFVEWATEINLEYHYILTTPIETPLPSSEIAAYRALHSNYPTTNVSNDCDAGMEVKANADLKMYIDSKIAEISTAILNN